MSKPFGPSVKIKSKTKQTMSFTTSLISSLASPPSLVPPHPLPPFFSLRNTVLNPTVLTRTRQQLFASYCLAAKAATSPSETANDVVLETTPTPAHEVVSSFYAAINVHDLSSVTDLIAQDCVYEDLVFSSPFVGRTVKPMKFSPFSELSLPNTIDTGDSGLLREVHRSNEYGSSVRDR